MSEGMKNGSRDEFGDVRENCYREKTGEEEAESSISFNPPVYRQRYEVVGEMIKKYHARKVLDFGCAEAKLLRYLIRNDAIKMECLVGVDIDEELLKDNTNKIEPLLCDWLNIRDTPFTVSMFQGSISQADDRFCHFDLMSCVEIIEHLIPEHLEKMPEVVFGQMSPKVVIVTTPNADFNVLFPDLQGFRHWDHKFEWTRQEFQEWSSLQAAKYDYNVAFQGIGKGPSGTEHLGCCSQMALFEKKETLQVGEKHSFGEPYQLIKHVEYPHRKSTITKEQKIIYEVDRLLWFLAQPNSYEEDINDTDDSYDDDNKPRTYKLSQLFDMGRLKELCGTMESLRSALKDSKLTLTADGDSVLYSPPKWESDDSEDENNDLTDITSHSCDDIIHNDTTMEEDWDLDSSNDLCWNAAGNHSIYWNGQDRSEEILNKSDGSDTDSENNVSIRCQLKTSWLEDVKTEDAEQDGCDDCDSDDDLPWITASVVKEQ